MEELFNMNGWRITRESGVLPDGRKKTIMRVHRCPAVHILAFRDTGKILILREFRPIYGQWIWMVPSGHVDKESDIHEAAQRELREETGFRAKHLTFGITISHSEGVDINNHIFVAKDLEKAPLDQDDDEMIEVHELTLDEAIEKVLTSPIVHTPSAFALLWYFHKNQT